MNALRLSLYGWLMVLPAAALLALFTHIPVVESLVHSFMSTDKPKRPSHFVGLDNYESLIADPIFWRALTNNLIYALGSVPLSIAIALLMALFVNDKLAGRGFLRAAYFTPTILPMIAVANIWIFFFTPDYGLLEQMLKPFGWGGNNFLGSNNTALLAVTIVAIWKESGFFMIFYLAALQQIPPDLKEAAAIEGTSRLTCHFSFAHANDLVCHGQCADQCVPRRRSYFRDDGWRTQ